MTLVPSDDLANNVITRRKRPEVSGEKAVLFDDRFADNLFALRRALRLTRADLERRTGLSRQAIEKIEIGNGSSHRRRVSIGEAIVLAEGLGVQPAQLLKEPAR